MVFQNSFRVFNSSEWNVELKYITVWNRVSWCGLEKTLQLPTTILLIGIENCLALNFLRRWLFCSPRLVYQMFTCRYSKTLLTWFCESRQFQIDLQFSRFIIVAFNCYQLAFEISQAKSIKVQLSSDFNRFPVFGLAHKPLIDFGVVNATFWCEFMAERFFESLLVWGVVTLTFHCFSNMIFDSPILIHETVSLVGSFYFQLGIFRVLGCEHCQTAI